MEHKEFVLAYVNDEWLTWEEANTLAIQRDEEAKEQFLASVLPEDHSNYEWYTPASYV